MLLRVLDQLGLRSTLEISLGANPDKLFIFGGFEECPPLVGPSNPFSGSASVKLVQVCAHTRAPVCVLITCSGLACRAHIGRGETY
jgi:hypothetical protein